VGAKQRSSLPARRAFVVQLHADAKVEQGQWQGRGEPLVSYQATRFESLAELVAFMVRVLTELEPQEYRGKPNENDTRGHKPLTIRVCRFGRTKKAHKINTWSC
jgi:hypothetical protein